MKKNIIFICIHNSARSQMAEAYMKKFHGDKFNVYSAGLEEGKLNELIVEVMKLDGLDISNQKSEMVDLYLKKDIVFDYVITVCDESNAEKCPYFPGEGKRLHISFKDPSSLSGKQEDKIYEAVKIRNEIKVFIKNILKFL